MLVKHLSVRVPWHDKGWNGTICEHPTDNASCLFLTRINEKKDACAEEKIAGKDLPDFIKDEMPPCVGERVTFMSPREITRKVSHPYAKTDDLYKHFLPKSFPMPPYSFAAVPFRWMRKDQNHMSEIAEELNLEYNSDYEPRLKFSTPWIQDHRNQRALLNSFYKFVTPKKSLCFIYAKHIPYYEKSGRVLIGVGRILKIEDVIEYDYNEAKETKSVIWERIVHHSIREDFSDGIILPYKEVFEKVKGDPTIEMEQFVAVAPSWEQFSYATEHVTHDVAIDSLLAIELSLRRMSKHLDRNFSKQLEWINDRISELWKARGAYPGFGSVLSALGIEEGNIIAWELTDYIEKNYGDSFKVDIWDLMEKVITNPEKFLQKALALKIGETIKKTWSMLSPERKQFLKLLSRLELTNDQTKMLYDNGSRGGYDLIMTDKEIIENPYQYYEKTRFTNIPVEFNIVDKGIYPSNIIRENFPLPVPSIANEATDKRRVRALVMSILEKASKDGHSLLPMSKIIQQIKELTLSQKCPINNDIMNAIEPFFNEQIIIDKEDEIESKTYQLKRLFDFKKIISDFTIKRVNGKRHEIKADWEKLLNDILKDYDSKDKPELLARKEKTASLKELAESRFTVLIGPAGTGKTTLLRVLCNQYDIKSGGVLLLAPTGKARVQMSGKIGKEHNAQTIAQFLLKWNRYDESTQRYYTSDTPKYDGVKTVIVDESSMLTEDQLSALIDSLKGVERFILVGDYRQLPPIGTGRPFVDIITYLRDKSEIEKFPKVGSGYAELTIIRRQNTLNPENMQDLKLAKWFSGNPLLPSEDDIFDCLTKGDQDERIKLISWNDPNELQEKLLEGLKEELKLKNIKDSVGFELSLGGTQDGSYMYFNKGAEEKVEDWQILSPVKGQGFGTKELNRLIQKTYRKGTIEVAEDFRRKLIPQPQGSDRIVYGDKVINISNKRRYKVFPKEGALQYVANGEIGIVTGMFRRKTNKWPNGVPLPINVHFSSQPGFSYSYMKNDFKEEGESLLELAYAITVHKSQGSDFKSLFLILPNPCILLSRELLYTALTRQKDRIVIFHQGDIRDFKKYSYDNFSDISKRITNLFYKPKLTEIDNIFFEDKLINKSIKGTLLRSKSELIIANLLEKENIEYLYEKKLLGKDGGERYPDFTIIDEDYGITYYWEHLGMLSVEAYRKKWEEKLKWYKDQDVLPLEDGGGKKGTLIITKDSADGGLDSAEIEKTIKRLSQIKPK